MEFDTKVIKRGIGPYLDIMSKVNTPSFCGPEFQRRFNAFYRVRQRPKTWYEAFYDIFRKCYKSPMSFKEVLTEMFERTKRLEPSFCSKLIATLNPDMPIWDKYVLQWLGFPKNDEPKGKKQKIEYFASIYRMITKEYNGHFSDSNIEEAIKRFDASIPEGKNISKMKKLDFMLWSNRTDKTVSILDYDKMLYSDEYRKQNQENTK